MKKIVLYTLAISYFMLITGCSDDDFLNIKNPNEITSESFFNNITDVNLALTAVYSSLISYELYGSNFIAHTLFSLAHDSDQDWLGTIGWNELCQNEATPGNSMAADNWRSWYRVVARANDFLTNANKFLEKKELTDANKAEVDKMIGQAYFFRAYAYFQLIRLYGTDSPARNANALGVPIVVSVASMQNEVNIERSTVGAVYDLIIADFKLAEEKLPLTWDAANIARVTKYAAQGFLGQVYTYKSDWTNAKTYFEKVINSGRFSLVNMGIDYDNMFHGYNEFSKESIFEINVSADLAENVPQGGTGAMHALLCAPRPTGYSNIFPHDVNIVRFGSDPRLQYNTVQPGVIIEGVTVTRFTPNALGYGWSFRKYCALDKRLANTNNNYGANFQIMRLADVFLMYAEALTASGADATALEYLNKVHRRAYSVADYNIATPGIDYTALTGTALRDTIREERFKELFSEGHRWYDICRWGIVETEVNKYGRVNSGAIHFDAKDYYLPIPVDELNNNSKMVQSPGYE